MRVLTVFRCVNLQNRMWRKTRSRNAGSSCMGTDPNRNWNFAWAGTHIVTNTSFHNYGGSFSMKNWKLFSKEAHCTSYTGSRRKVEVAGKLLTKAARKMLASDWTQKTITDQHSNKSWNWFVKSRIPGSLLPVLENLSRRFSRPNWPPLGLWGWTKSGKFCLWNLESRALQPFLPQEIRNLANDWLSCNLHPVRGNRDPKQSLIILYSVQFSSFQFSVLP